MMCLLDYDYGSALGSNRVHPSSESAIDSALVRGNCPMNSLGLRTESMLDCLELLARFADPTAASAMRDAWSDSAPPLFARHPGDEEEEVPKTKNSTTRTTSTTKTSTTTRMTKTSTTRILTTRMKTTSTKNSTTRSTTSTSTRMKTTISTTTKISTTSTRTKTKSPRCPDPTRSSLPARAESRSASNLGRGSGLRCSRDAMIAPTINAWRLVETV